MPIIGGIEHVLLKAILEQCEFFGQRRKSCPTRFVQSHPGETKITQRIGDDLPPCRANPLACLMQALKALKQSLVLTHFGLISANFD